MVQPTTSPRGRPGRRPAAGVRALGRTAAVAVAAGLVAIGALLSLDPARRLGVDPTSTLGFAMSVGSTVLLFAAAFAVLAPAVDLVAAWVRTTPESERRARSGDGGDGGFFDLWGSGDSDCGGDGGGDGGGD